jgi:thioredoxin 1
VRAPDGASYPETRVTAVNDQVQEGNVGDVVKELTDETFQQTIDGAANPVIVDFWAAWCGPCRTVGPIVEDLASTHADKVTVGKLNVDDNQATAAKFGIMSIPTLILFKDGKPVKKIIGVRSKGDLEREFELV